MSEPLSIAIDGPAGSGKSTVGEKLARQLGYLYVDTGAMYRAVAWLALQKRIDVNNGPALGRLAQQAGIVISHPHLADGRQYTVTVRGRDITWDIRDAAVTHAVSPVSAHPEVRTILVEQQRAMAKQDHIVMVGRDIGSVVLPNADLKIYLTASLEERARRRHAEFVERLGAHNPSLPSLETVIHDIKRRDSIDRDHMQPARDAIVVETDSLDVSQVLEEISRHMKDAV